METIKLDLIPGKKMPSLHASQFDDGREHGIDLFENGVVYKLDGTETLTINERKGDDCICSLDIVNTFAESNHIVFASTEQMCAVWGNNICELVIAKGEKTIGTLNFILEIEQSPTEDGIESESEIKNLKRQIEAITEEVIGDDYYTAEETDEAIATAIEGKADTTYVDTELGKKADKSNTYTKTEVDEKIDELPEPMIFKGTLGVGGTIQSLPDASASNEGYTYKVITDGTYAGQTAKVGDVFTSNGSAWVLIPSGDEDNDTWRNIKVNGVEKLGNGISSGAVDFVGSENIEVDFDGNGNKVSVKTKNIYTKTEVDDIVYNILPDDTASGAIANFETDLALPIKSLEVDVNAVQASGTPTPQSPKAISGVSAVNVVHCEKNLVDIKPFNEWEFSHSYCLLLNCIPNKQVKMSFIDKDVSVDVSGVYFGFVDSNYDKVSALTSQQYRWCLNQGNIINRTNLSTQGDNILTGLLIYPNTQDVFDRLFARYNIVISINDETSYEPYNGSTTLINLGGTYYGGHFTQDKAGHRQFVITHAFYSFDGTENVKPLTSDNRVYIDNLPNVYRPSSSSEKVIISSHYLGSSQSQQTDGTVYKTTGNNAIVFHDNVNGVDKDTFKAFLLAQYQNNTPVTIVYQVATPYVIDLPDGEPIATLVGTNNIYADTGDTSVVFKDSVNGYVEKKIASVQALALNT